MICSVIMVFVWSLVHDFLEDLWESGHWQLIRLRCGVSVFRPFENSPALIANLGVKEFEPHKVRSCLM